MFPYILRSCCICIPYETIACSEPLLIHIRVDVFTDFSLFNVIELAIKKKKERKKRAKSRRLFTYPPWTGGGGKICRLFINVVNVKGARRRFPGGVLDL